MKLDEFISRLESRILSTDVDYPNITNLCYEAKEYGIQTVTVFPNMLDMCRKVIGHASVALCALSSYPHGGMSTEQKVRECINAVAYGAKEVEVVGNTRETKSFSYDYIRNEMQKVKEAVGKDILVKFIIEIEYLSDEEAVLACKAAMEAGIDYIVTSTGEYCTLDEKNNDVMLIPTEKEVRLIRDTVRDTVHIQAEGNIVDTKTALALLKAGADRISTPCPVKLIREFEQQEEA